MMTCENKRFGPENICGVALFTWSGWDDIDNDLFQFYDVEFIPKSMKKYDGCTVGLCRNGKIEIYDKNEDHVQYSAYVTDIPEVLNELIAMKEGKVNV